MGLYDTTKSLASAWAEGTKRRLQARGRPNTRVDSGGTQGSYSFDGQEISRSELRDVKEMRESGGIVSHLVHAKSMMQFGTGADFEAENDEASNWLHEQFQDLDNLLIDLGEDATWFPYSAAEVVETQGGEFSHIECVEPWTLEPVTNEHGEIIAWEQYTKGGLGNEPDDVYEPDEIATFVLNKASGRDKTGVSEVLRAEDEITHFKENQKVMSDALQYLVPHHHWIIGSEGQTVIDDNELRRFRNRIDNLKGDTQIISGPGVKHEQIDLPKFDIKEITNNDLRQLCVALGVPIELASVISEGLGSGEQSSARQVFFDLEKEAKQRALGGQFVEQIARILLRDYSTFDHEQQLDLVFRNARTAEERKQVVDAIGDDLKVNERRSLFEYADLDDEAKGESFDSPGEESQDDDPFGGMFTDAVDTELEKRGLGTGNAIDLEEFEAALDDIHESFVMAEETDKKLVQFNESELPEMVLSRMREAVMGGALFSDIESIPSGARSDLQAFLMDELEDDGWSLDSMSREISDIFDVSEDRAEMIARSETQSITNEAAEGAYKEMEQERGEEFVYKWVGNKDSRTTDACEWLLNETNPKFGGTPVSLERLKELIQEAPEHDPDLDNNMAREWAPHPQCRKRYVRVVE